MAPHTCHALLNISGAAVGFVKGWIVKKLYIVSKVNEQEKLNGMYVNRRTQLYSWWYVLLH